MTRTYLICDKSAVFRNILRNILEKEECYIIETQNGEETYSIFEEFEQKNKKIDITFVDSNLQDESSLNLIEKINKLSSYKKTILCMTTYDEEMIYEAIKQGVDGFLNKPYQFERVMELVEKI